MTSFQDVDTTRELRILPQQYDLDQVVPVMRTVEGLAPVVLTGEEVKDFLAIAAGPYWKHSWESEMQRLYDLEDGTPIISAFMPLVTFRTHFCAWGGDVFDRLRGAVRSWRDAGVDEVELAAVDLRSRPRRSLHAG